MVKKNKAIGNRMRELREMKGRSRTAMGSLLGISRQAWSLYEMGQRIPNAERIGELAAACGISTDWLILGKGDPP